jgi:hypothetical protein
MSINVDEDIRNRPSCAALDLFRWWRMLQCVLKTDTQSQESITDTNQLRITFDGIIKAGGGGDDDDVTATPPRC